MNVQRFVWVLTGFAGAVLVVLAANAVAQSSLGSHVGDIRGNFGGGVVSAPIDMAGNRIYDSTKALNLGTSATTSHGLVASDDVIVGGKFEVNGNMFADGNVALLDNFTVQLGTGNDMRVGYIASQTPDAGAIGIGTDSRVVMLVEGTDYSTDWMVPQQTDPSFCTMASDHTDITKYGCRKHDGTDLTWTVAKGGYKYVSSSGKGQTTGLYTRTATATFSANPGDASVATSGLVLQGEFVVGISSRVTTTATNCASVSLGIGGGDVDMFASATGITSGTTTDNDDATAAYSWTPAGAASEVTVTANGGNCFDGVWSITAHFFDATAATSN